MAVKKINDDITLAYLLDMTVKKACAIIYGEGSGGTPFWFGTRAEYNALPEKDPNTCYCIEEGS